MALKTRRPTGRPGFPKILLEGGDKSGKSYALAMLSASPKIGRTAVMVLGEDESKWDEFGQLPGVRFELIEHDGSWRSVIGQVEDAKDEAAKALANGEPPFVLGIDTVTEVWSGLKDWASARARNSQKNRKILEKDPDAEIDVSSNYWNDARARWRQLMRLVLTFPGIVVLVARGGEVAYFQDGKPVANKTTWSVEGEKNLPYDVSAHVRLSRDARPTLVSAASLACPIRPGIDRGLPLPDGWSLEGVIFDTLKLDPGNVAAGSYQQMTQERMTPEQIRDEALSREATADRVRDLYRLAKESRYDDVILSNEHGTDEPILKLLGRVGTELSRAEQGTPGSRPSGHPAGAAEDRMSEDEYVTDFLVRLGDTQALDGIARRKNEINAALSSGQITARVSSELREAVTKRQRLIEEQDAAADAALAPEAGAEAAGATA